MKHLIYVDEHGLPTWGSKTARDLIRHPRQIEPGQPGSSGVRVMMEGDFGWELLEEDGEMIIALFRGDRRHYSAPLWPNTLYDIRSNTLAIRSGVEPNEHGFVPIKAHATA